MFDSALCWPILDFKLFPFPDSELYNTVRSYIFREYLHENEFFSKTILDCSSGTQTVGLMKKMANNLVALPLLRYASKTIPKTCLDMNIHSQFDIPHYLLQHMYVHILYNKGVLQAIHTFIMWFEKLR